MMTVILSYFANRLKFTFLSCSIKEGAASTNRNRPTRLHLRAIIKIIRTFVAHLWSFIKIVAFFTFNNLSTFMELMTPVLIGLALLSSLASPRSRIEKETSRARRVDDTFILYLIIVSSYGADNTHL